MQLTIYAGFAQADNDVEIDLTRDDVILLGSITPDDAEGLFGPSIAKVLLAVARAIEEEQQ